MINKNCSCYLVLALFWVASLSLPLNVSSNDIQTLCTDYAQQAVVDNQRAEQLGCTFAHSNARWHAQLVQHQQWCITTAASKTPIEQQARYSELKSCENRVAYCHYYSQRAQRQFQRNQEWQCHFTHTSETPPHWSNDYQQHYRYCMQAPNAEQATADLNNRRQALIDCKKR